MKRKELFLVWFLLLNACLGDLSGWGETIIEPDRLKILENFEKGIRTAPRSPNEIPKFTSSDPSLLEHVGQEDPLRQIPAMVKFDQHQTQSVNEMMNNLTPSNYGSTFNLVGKEDQVDEVDEIAPLENDYKGILDTFKKIGCFPKRDKAVKMEDARTMSEFAVRFAKNSTVNEYSLCDEDVVTDLLAPLGFQNGTKTSIYNHFRNKIYRPLGYKVTPYRHSYADVLHDLIYLDESDQTIRKSLPMPTIQDFMGIIMGSFSQISSYSADFENNKDIISRIILDILKQFHIFWNISRQKNMLSNTKINTYTVIKKIISRYRETNNAMRAITLTILQNIKDAYFRFVKAHKLHEMIKGKPSNIVVYQFLKRYDENVRRIRANKSDEYTEVYELSVFLDMLRALYVINYYGKKDNLQSRQFFKDEVVEKIKRIFKAYKEFMVSNNDPALNRVKDFTATLLLKLHHRTFVIFEIYTIEGYVSKPLFNYNNQFMNGIKLFYELTDNLMLVPGQCQDLLSVKLEFCARQKVFDILTDLYNKYLLYSSVSGANMYRYVFDSLNDMLTDMKYRKVFNNFIFFRNYYFAELFKFSEVYRDQYKIQDMSVLSELENAVGMQIEQLKIDSSAGNQNAAAEMADQIDQKLYDFFLGLKADFNQFGPLKNNFRQLQEIGKRVQNTIEKVSSDAGVGSDSPFNETIKKIKSATENWLEKHRTKYTLQVSMENAETPATQYVPLPAKDSEIIHTYINEPQTHSGLMIPVSMPNA